MAQRMEKFSKTSFVQDHNGNGRVSAINFLPAAAFLEWFQKWTSAVLDVSPHEGREREGQSLECLHQSH